MAFERKWPAVSPQTLVANSGAFYGLVTLASTAGFRVKQVAALTANTLAPLAVQVKIVLSPTEMIVGYVDNQIANWKRIDISAYTTILNSQISAEWQDKNKIGVDDISKAIYEADPVVANRVASVDQYGDMYTPQNPLPVNPIGRFFGSLTLGALGITTIIGEMTYGITYNEITSSITGNVETLTFLEDSVEVEQITITYLPDGWDIKTVFEEVSYLLLENGNKIELEVGGGDILLE